MNKFQILNKYKILSGVLVLLILIFVVWLGWEFDIQSTKMVFFRL